MRLGPCLTTLTAVLAAAVPSAMGRAQTAPAATAPFVPPSGLSVIATFHAEGAQIYECLGGTDGRLAWQFREPIATLLEGGRTVGRHYAGPSWELADGTGIMLGRVTGRMPGGSADDIPWLRLEVAERRGTAGGGRLALAAVILRVNTAGGVASGACPAAGAFRSVAYTADYVFLASQPGN